jgi:hypothetical protein
MIPERTVTSDTPVADRGDLPPIGLCDAWIALSCLDAMMVRRSGPTSGKF